MVLKLNSSDTNFKQDFIKFLNIKHDEEKNVDDEVRAIIQQVRDKGDVALKDYTKKFDNFHAESLKIEPEKLQQAYETSSRHYLQAMQMAVQRVTDFHQKTYPEGFAYQDEEGLRLAMRYTPIDRVGVYIPGGQAAYPSSAYMSIVPAKVAGVGHITAVVPHMNGECNPLVLATLHHLGVTDVWAVGGAQAIAALAYGTETITAVDMIAGPGNIYVATAKKQLYGKVGIDMIAGPSEILVLSDSSTSPQWTALDLLAQAEHDPMAQSILISIDQDHIDAVLAEMEQMLPTLSRRAIIEKSWHHYGAVIKVKDWDEAMIYVNKIAPEHLQISLEDAYHFAHQAKHAGAIFLGKNSCGAMSDYSAGPSHVLPTNHSARFASALSTQNFLKRTSILECSEEAVIHLSENTATLAEMEGLDAHKKSMEIRLENLGN